MLKYKSAQILQLETHAKTCYNFYKISFIPLGTLVRYTDRKGGEAVEYSDHELVRGIKGGDKSALELLVRRWYPRIYGYVFKLTGHEQDASAALRPSEKISFDSGKQSLTESRVSQRLRFTLPLLCAAPPSG